MEAAKKYYHSRPNKIDAICDEMDIKTEEGNLLSKAIGIGKFFLEARRTIPSTCRP